MSFSTADFYDNYFNLYFVDTAIELLGATGLL
jgi:hypothetical protein